MRHWSPLWASDPSRSRARRQSFFTQARSAHQASSSGANSFPVGERLIFQVTGIRNGRPNRRLDHRERECYCLECMKVLITGGAGFIGSHVADAYIGAGHDVIITDNLTTGSTKNIPKKAKFYLLDIGSRELDKVFELEKPEIVNHQAA
jgi:hypothetical protein